MHSVSAVGGLGNALNSVTQNKQPGPPDHAKAWGWRAKQAVSAEETQASGAAAGTGSTVTAETAGAVEAMDKVDQVSQDATATLPPPSEADMESVILGLITGFSETSGVDATPLYNDVKALFT